LNINFFTPRFFPAIAGGEFYILKLALTLKKDYSDRTNITCSSSIDFQGLTSHLGLTLSPKNPNFSNYKDMPINRLIPTYYEKENQLTQSLELNKLNDLCKSVGINLSLNCLKLFLENGPNLTTYIINKCKNIDSSENNLFHSTYLPYMSLIYSLILARSSKKVAICTPFFHIFNPRYNAESFIELLKLFDGVIACTEVERTFLNNTGVDSKKISVIPMGVDYNLYSNPIKSRTGKQKSFCQQFNINDPFVLFCGNKNYEKGAISLLKSIELVWKELKHVKFVFIGPTTNAFDSELQKVRKKMDDPKKIINLGPESMMGYDDWRKISAFQECSVYAMPSRSDAYGMTYLEAWASGKPVIGANNTVMSEVIRHETDGILIEFDNVESLSKSIIQLITNNEKANKLGTEGQKKVAIYNTWDNVTEKTRRFYESCINLN
jgi:glycosyltransferase involved in cell wall biosynthesis